MHMCRHEGLGLRSFGNIGADKKGRLEKEDRRSSCVECVEGFVEDIVRERKK